MTAQARSVVVRLSMDTAQAIAASKQFGAEMTAAMDKSEAATHRQSAALDKVGATAGKVALGAVAALGAMGKAAMDWESQWAGVAKTVDGTASQMADLEGELRGLARTMPATHQEIAATAEAAGQLGIAREDVADFTKTMVMLGETTNLTSDAAATSIAQFMNVMGTAADQADEIGNTLVDLGNKGASTEAQILDMAQRLSGAGSLVGATEADVLALASAMANLGIESELGGGAIQRVFANIYQSAAQGADGLSGFAEVAGMSAQDFAAQWENDPVRAFDAFLQGLGRVADSGGNVVGTLEDLGIKGTQNLQVMLRLAGAGDELTTSLDQSNTAWAQNTALIDEYSKRAETTASQVQVSWNRIKDAGIEAGESLLPIVADVAGAVGGIADAFGALPDPVQGLVGQLLGLAAVMGGAVWAGTKIVSGISATRTAVSDLTSTSTRGTKALKGLALAGAALAGLEIAAAGIKAIQEATDESLPGVNDLTVQLLQLRDGSLESLSSEFDSLAESIGRIADKSGTEAFFDALQTPFKGLFGESGDLREARAEIELLDEALTGLVGSGGPDVAADALEKLAKSANLSQDDMARLRDLLPGYKEALAGVEASADLAADGTEQVGRSAAASAPAVDLMTDALAETREAAQKTADSFIGLGDGLNDSKVSLGDWIGQLEEQATALANFRKNAEEAGDKGVRQGLIDALREAGPEGALRMKQLADATDEEIERANKAWRRGQDEVRRYTDEVGGVPPAVLEVETDTAEVSLRKVMRRLEEYGLTTEEATAALNDIASGKINKVQDLIDKYGLTKAQARALLSDKASPAIAAVSQKLAALDGDTATTYIKIVRWYQTKGSPGTTGTGGAGSMDLDLGGLAPRRKSDGGKMVGPGTGTSDDIPTWLSNGEYVIPAAAVSKYGQPFFDAIRAQRLAAGGPVNNPAATTGQRRRGRSPEMFFIDADILNATIASLGDNMDRLDKALLRELKQRDRLLDAEIDRETKRRDMLRQQGEAIESAIDSMLRSDIFNREGAQFQGGFETPEGATDADGNPLDDQAVDRQVLGAILQSMGVKVSDDQVRYGELSYLQSLYEKATRPSGSDVLRSDIAEGKELDQLISQLERKGLDGRALGALLQSGNMDEIRAYASSSRAELAQYERLYNRREEILAKAATAGSEAVVGKRLDRTNEHLRDLKSLERQGTEAIKQLEEAVKHAAEKAPREFADQLNQTSGRAARHR